MRGIVALSLCGLLLAGCSSSPEGDGAGPDFSDLGLDASDTTGLIRGIVVDDAIRPVAGANVTLTPGGQTARTTANGTFGFDGLAAGSYFLAVELYGYES